MIEAAFFYLFAAVMLGAGLMVVVSRNPVFGDDQLSLREGKPVATVPRRARAAAVSEW